MNSLTFLVFILGLCKILIDLYSTDGETWNLVFSNDTFAVWGLSYNTQEFIGIGYDSEGGVIVFGTDLANINQQTINAQNLKIQFDSGVAFGNEMWIGTVNLNEDGVLIGCICNSLQFSPTFSILSLLSFVIQLTYVTVYSLPQNGEQTWTERVQITNGYVSTPVFVNGQFYVATSSGVIVSSGKTSTGI